MNNLAEENIALAYHIAYQFRGYGVEDDELVSTAFIGLVKAANTFDKNNGAKFTTYAGVCIRRQLLRCITNEAKRFKRLPTDSFDMPIHGEEDLTMGDMIADNSNAVEKWEWHEDLKNAYSTLTDKEKAVIDLKFMQGKKSNEIADMLNTCRQEIWSVERRALKKMRKAMQA